jgi:hypothetical protein
MPGAATRQCFPDGRNVRAVRDRKLNCLHFGQLPPPPALNYFFST